MSVIISDLYKSYGSLPVFQGLNLTLEEPGRYCLMAPSGWGKTTLFRMLSGLESPDEGSITGLSKKRISCVFQEDRLLTGFTTLENVALAARKDLSVEAIKEEMSLLLPSHAFDTPLSSLSGGQKRRCAILRALLAPFDILIMDEPFTGLDEDTRQLTADFIKKRTASKLVLFSTHQKDDAFLLDGELLSDVLFDTM